MIKVYLCVGFSILFFLIYVFSFLFYQSEDSRENHSLIINLVAVKADSIQVQQLLLVCFAFA